MAGSGALVAQAVNFGRNLAQQLRAAMAGNALPAARWWWPTGWGSGDRGPPGSWQRGLWGPALGPELIAFSAVYACINTIASDISKLPVQVMQVDLTTGARRPIRNDYYVQLLREPNDYQTYSDFMYAFVQSYLFQGNTYCYSGQRNGRGEITAMHILNPYRVNPWIADNGEVFYKTSGNDWLAQLGPNLMVPERDMIHHRLMLLPGYPLMGVTPIFAAAASSAVGLKILQNSQTFFGNASRPSGVLTTPGRVSEPSRKRIQEEWQQAYHGDQYGKTAFLDAGLTWQPLTITAQDMQLIEQLRWSVEDVARVFRVPPFMLGDTSKVTYRNTEQLVRVYLTGCLAFHLQAIEDRLARAFDFPPIYEIEFDLSQLLRTEIDVRFKAYTDALNSGWQSINEVRAAEGLDPVPGGEEPRVQMQYVPLSQASAPLPPGAVPSSSEPAVAPPEPGAPAQEALDPVLLRQLMRERLRRAA